MEGGGGGGIVGLLFNLIVIVFFAVCMWKIYAKAGQPGWAAIIPIYNIVVLCQIVGRPVWWVVLTFIPVVNIVIYIILLVDLAKKFGKGVGFAIGMLLLSFIFLPMLAFGSAEFEG